MTEDIAKYVRERNAALTALDMEWARKQIPKASSDDVRLVAMHKARYECVDIDPMLRERSRGWLQSRGYSRVDYQPWPDKGLPEDEGEVAGMIKVYRVQNGDGRGPFQPGITNQWIDYLVDKSHLLPWFQEMPADLIARVLSQPGHKGTACATKDQLREWFNAAEYHRLAILGFHAVMLNVDEIYYEGEYQLLFGRHKPLRDGASRINLWDGS